MIRFKHVTKVFPDGTIAFENLSFDIDDGELALITGPSGSGKTTVMRLLIREYQPNQGEVEFDGKSLTTIKANYIPRLRRKIGVVFQDYKLIEELNVWENIALPLFIKKEKQANIEERITDLLKLVELTDKALMFPRQLSGGEAQRISIARALATGPKVIFADEPTGNLDKKASLHIIKLLKKINELGTTLLIATHDQMIMNELDVKKIDLEKVKAIKQEPAKSTAAKPVEQEKTTAKFAKKPKRVKIAVKQEASAQPEKQKDKTKKPMQAGRLGKIIGGLFKKKSQIVKQQDEAKTLEKKQLKNQKSTKKSSD